ncbi:MAG TPA: HemK/PrmC family methyltransferase [Candidatus Saccharimonadales bacterium]|nr:HemK/PrmC family methyltransferase [Candidatus Saccharimonadales bacterium]
MTTGEFLSATTATFKQAGIESARLDALILLEDALGQDRAIILAYPEHELTEHAAAQLHTKTMQREQQIPLAYIRGHAPFYGREFTVTEQVLVPRPESESMITLLKQHAPEDVTNIADIGTGSGCLGITAVLELKQPDSAAPHVHLYDTSVGALDVAKQNTERHRLHNASTHRSDLLESIAEHLDIILANLPYVPEHVRLNAAAEHEPAEAIFSGPDGLDHYKRFWTQASTLKHTPQLIITESLPAQHHVNAELARAAGFFQLGRDGFAQAFAPLT